MIQPVRLKGTSASIARYYTVGDYYPKCGDEPSEWGGALAEELGLSGEVDAGTLKTLLAGKVSEQQLGCHRKDGKIEHHSGWDFAVNAPKSVSIMALVVGDERILPLHEKAVGSSLNYREEHASLRRRNDGEIQHHTTGRLLFARFTEHASRELDPHLHTHVVVLNMTNATSGDRMSSLETRAMFTEQMTAGQIYRNDLAHGLRELRYDIDYEPRSGLFEIRNVPKELIRELSQRSEQIEAHAKEHGHEGQAERRRSLYATRPKKEKTTLEGLHQQWQQRTKSYTKLLSDLKDAADLRGERELPPDPSHVARTMLFGVRNSENREAVNNLGKLLRVGLASEVGSVRLGDIRPLADKHEQRRKLLAAREPTGDGVLVRGRTTRTTARLELSLTQLLALSLADAQPIASADRLLQALRQSGLNRDQEQALVQVALSRDRVNGIHGVAGSGKSTLVKVLVDSAVPLTAAIALAPTSPAAAELGHKAGIESRTVVSMLVTGGRGLTPNHILVVDEAGQLGNRQSQRILQLSRVSGARVLFLGDNKQTGAIEQGKAFWLLQRLGMPTAQLPEAVRQETRTMKAAVSAARAGDYESSLSSLDRIVAMDKPEDLAKSLVAEWSHLNPKSLSGTNILVLDNATRLIANSLVREVLKKEGMVAVEETRLAMLSPTGMSEEEKRAARFYSGGQVVSFSRDNAGLRIAHGAEYRVVGLGRDGNGRQIVRLADENCRIIRWGAGLGSVRQVNVFKAEERDLAQGDRIRWRLVNKELGLKNAERGTVERLEGALVTIRWDQEKRVSEVDLSKHKTWDHGYAETVYSAQSKTYDRVYVLAPLGSGLVNGQNYYTAITRARFGVKLWTQDAAKLAAKLTEHSGEKASALEGLGRLERDAARRFTQQHSVRLDLARDEQARLRQERHDENLRWQLERRTAPAKGIADRFAAVALTLAAHLDRMLDRIIARTGGREDGPTSSERPRDRSGQPDKFRGPER